MNKRIGIDIHSLSGRHTGVAMYVRSLITWLAKRHPQAPINLLAMTDFPRQFLIDYPIIKIPGRRFWTTFWLSWYWLTHHQRPSVVLYPAHLLPLYSPMKNVITVHDLAFELFPDHFTARDRMRLSRGTRRAVKKADHIIAVSNSAKNDLVRLYRVPESKITTIYEGCDTEFFQPASVTAIETVKQKYQLNRPYVITVGTLQKRKNHIALVEALAQVKEAIRIDLVFAGGKGWLYDELLQRITELGLEDRVKLLGYVPDEDRPPLYSGAALFALPSLYEGFGLPILEAMACGAPVLTANNSALTEVGADAALFVDAHSIEAIAEGLVKIIKDTTLRQRLIEKGFEQVKKFSWATTADQTLVLLEKIGGLN